MSGEEDRRKEEYRIQNAEDIRDGTRMTRMQRIGRIRKTEDSECKNIADKLWKAKKHLSAFGGKVPPSRIRVLHGVCLPL